MKSLVTRLSVWFGSSIVLVTVLTIFASHHSLVKELRDENWRHDYPNHPDWIIHGSFSPAEINHLLEEIIGHALLYGVPLALGAAAMGYWVARKSVKPIGSLNRQLQSIGPHTLSRRIELPEMDREFKDLVRHINALIQRLEIAFAEMSEYAAKVAHELRTPLAILRLKVEQAGTRIPDDFSDEVQAELHQLTHVVDQSLLIAKAEQGRVVIHQVEFDLGAMLVDIADDFSRLAQEEGRSVRFSPPPFSCVVADAKYTRQIIHNLFSNAHKHGQGDTFVELSRGNTVCTLTISNLTRTLPGTAADTLGLGLRVVDSLLRLQPAIKCERCHNEREYSVRMEFPRGGDQRNSQSAAATTAV